jgi:hypothetical protein
MTAAAATQYTKEGLQRQTKKFQQLENDLIHVFDRKLDENLFMDLTAPTTNSSLPWRWPRRKSERRSLLKREKSNLPFCGYYFHQRAVASEYTM